MKIASLFVTALVLLSSSLCIAQENIILSALSTSKKLILLNIEYANKKYKVVDSAVFNLPVQGGLTAMAPLPNGRAQVVWTVGPATQGISANSMIKIKSMIVDSDLNQVGPIKTLPPNLTAHYNFNHLPAIAAGSPTTKITFLKGRNLVRMNRNSVTGNLFGPADTVFTVPGTGLQIDTDFDGENYAGLRYDGSRYNFVCGNVNNPTPTVVASFLDDVINSTILPTSNDDNFNFVLMKRKNNPEKISIENFRIDGQTCRPIGNSLIHLPPVNQNLGQLGFFGGITSTPSETSPNGGHVFFIRSSNDGTDILAYHMNTVTGKKDSPPTVIGPDIANTPEELFLTGLFVAGGLTLFNR